jgi:hypothetical protein
MSAKAINPFSTAFNGIKGAVVDRLDTLTSKTQVMNEKNDLQLELGITEDDSSNYVENSHYINNLEQLSKLGSDDFDGHIFFMFINERDKIKHEPVLMKHVSDEIDLWKHPNTKFRRHKEYCGQIISKVDLDQPGAFIVDFNPVYVDKNGSLIIIDTVTSVYCDISVSDDDEQIHKVFVQDMLPTPLHKLLNEREKLIWTKFDKKDKGAVIKSLKEELKKSKEEQPSEKFILGEVNFSFDELPQMEEFKETKEEVKNEIIFDIPAVKPISKQNQTDSNMVASDFQSFLQKRLPLFLVNLIPEELFTLVNSEIKRETIITIIENRIYELNVKFNNVHILNTNEDHSNMCMSLIAHNLLLEYTKEKPN